MFEKSQNPLTAFQNHGKVIIAFSVLQHKNQVYFRGISFSIGHNSQAFY